jgi:hypothetical protein
MSSRQRAGEELFGPADMASGLEALCERLRPTPPRPDLWTRIDAATPLEGRFRRFIPQVSHLLDLSDEDALRCLDQAASAASYAPGFFPGMSLLHVRGGAAVANAITGFVRVAGGLAFPRHRHLGQESVLIVQGRLLDDGRVCEPADVVVMPAGSAHAFSVLPGPDLLYLAVVERGLEIDGMVLTPDDARA